MAEHVVAFPDTNIFLHFKRFDQISWTKELDADSVCLRIAHIVIAELNRHKDSHPVEHVRERARKTLSKARKVVFSAGGRVDERVRLVCDTEQATGDLKARGLNPESSDDCILAAALDYQEAHAGERVVLVTDDSGFALRAHTYGLASTELSPKLKIPPQADAKGRKIQELEARLRQVERGLPRLRLTFAGGADRAEPILQPESVPTIEAARAYVATHVAPRFPLQQTVTRQELAQKAGQPLPEAAAAIMEAVSSIGEMMMTRRNAGITTYLERYAQYALATAIHRNELARTVELRLTIANEGSIPAEDVNLSLRFPRSVSLILNGQLPPAPKPPPPPGQTPGPVPAQAIPRVPPAAADSLRLVRANDAGEWWEVRYRLDRLNHHLDEHFAVHIQFPSCDSAAAFRIDYRIAAVNAPDPVMGSLHVVPGKPTPRTKALARRQSRPK